MICYRDMTFCTYWENCANGATCSRALTKFTEYGAREIDLPICQFAEKPECFVEIPNMVKH